MSQLVFAHGHTWDQHLQVELGWCVDADGPWCEWEGGSVH